MLIAVEMQSYFAYLGPNSRAEPLVDVRFFSGIICGDIFSPKKMQRLLILSSSQKSARGER